MTKATLAILGTPIGNLKDISYRAVETLTKAQVIFCEDTRVTHKLLKAYNITTPCKTYNTHSGERGIQAIAETLQPGALVVLVTDAGMPAISDPGSRVVAWARQHLREQAKVVVIPGPDAVSTAIAGAGARSKGYIFFGFLPTKKGRQTELQAIMAAVATTAGVVYESPHRILKLLTELEALGYVGNITIGRELTKMHEEFLHGTASELLRLFDQSPEKVRGEFTLVLHPPERLPRD